jgi:hypothetical protein
MFDCEPEVEECELEVVVYDEDDAEEIEDLLDEDYEIEYLEDCPFCGSEADVDEELDAFCTNEDCEFDAYVDVLTWQERA